MEGLIYGKIAKAGRNDNHLVPHLNQATGKIRACVSGSAANRRILTVDEQQLQGARTLGGKSRHGRARGIRIWTLEYSRAKPGLY